mmetsp:Transcript_37081/g.82479  ORF Transcript_37081/g.82479 Transcript_37081/m.82479 type:complete len:172 (+) Transcript_37081:44-559(+)|eukprot:CAMPEP_0202900572 /NCGR_PEP_ID=MMETSP1392-20130828/11911_1 /ASSEMBLY_ACC=CAM_ASM_000868 /TAXON_ID=225041 /ORGANISM="Chlamydomonas chlamydogama, Strain SAG 11-48b" /LENGTH=171 /DNA_ID=CAMNT_0049586987 /DNA_START=45 /DNA_END=560 /DNA_ORIENTATION=-
MALHQMLRSNRAVRPFTSAFQSQPCLRPVTRQVLNTGQMHSNALMPSPASAKLHAVQLNKKLLRDSTVCQALDPKDGKASGSTASLQFNAAYVAIFGAFAALFLFQNPYIFAALSILIIIPQNSAVTSLNSLVLIFYESGLFMNFAEAVYCVRLVTWLSISCTLVGFALFA